MFEINFDWGVILCSLFYWLGKYLFGFGALHEAFRMCLEETHPLTATCVKSIRCGTLLTTYSAHKGLTIISVIIHIVFVVAQGMT